MIDFIFRIATGRSDGQLILLRAGTASGVLGEFVLRTADSIVSAAYLVG